MRYRRFGQSDLEVSEVGFGVWTLASDWWGHVEDKQGMLHAALDAGINFIDTADVYSAGESEEIVAKALTGRREDVVLATKVHGAMGEGPNKSGNSRRWIVRECENSLRRLGTDYIDLYQIHRPDPHADIDDTLGALTDLVRAGKVLYLGSSTFPASEIVEAQWVAERRGRERFVCEQPPYSMLVRAIETDVLPTCARYGMGVIPWSPLGGGWLSGKWRKGATDLTSHRANRIPARYDLSVPGNQQKLEAADALGRLADEVGVPLVQLAVAWVIRNPAVTSAIIGPRTMEQLTSQLGAADVELSGDVLDRIDEIVPPGSNVNVADTGWDPASLRRSQRRRPRRPGRG